MLKQHGPITVCRLTHARPVGHRVTLSTGGCGARWIGSSLLVRRCLSIGWVRLPYSSAGAKRLAPRWYLVDGALSQETT